MEEYLSTSEYFIHYHTHDKIKRKIYTRLEDIDFPCKKVKSYFASDYIALRDKYKELRQIVKKILIDIQMQKLTIRDISYMNEMDIIVYYNLQDSFILSHEGFDEIKESAEMVDADGHSVTITYSDLEKAFMLGIDNIDIIIRLKIKFGNIENVLNT